MTTHDECSRRRFVQGAVSSGMFLGAGMGTWADRVRAASEDDEHFFIFLEMRGGVLWNLATDGRDLSQLPLDNKDVVRSFEVTETAPDNAVFKQDVLREGNPFASGREMGQHGKLLMLPYIGDLQSSYRNGVSSLGCPYTLGFAAQDLAAHVNDIAVVRGVNMFGTFHGGANREIFSGATDGACHLGGVLAQMLDEKYGPRLLDNLVFEAATYYQGQSFQGKRPISIDAASLGFMLGATSTAAESSGTPEQRFTRAKLLAEAIGGMPTLSSAHRKVFEYYSSSLGTAPQIRSRLLDVQSQLSSKDASLDLDLQFSSALTLIESGLTRVITLCLGSPNGKNNVDGFGLFDAHSGVFFYVPNATGTVNTQRHHRNVSASMTSMAKLVRDLKARPWKNGKSMFDVTTVVVGTEFARPSNLSGNENSGVGVGNGHYWWNNNYIMFGKGVRGGCWVGKGDPIRQTGYNVDFGTIETQDPQAMVMTPQTFAFTPKTVGTTLGSDENGEGTYQLQNYTTSGTKRPFMARDVVKSVMAIAGLEEKFSQAYNDPLFADAKVIRPLVK